MILYTLLSLTFSFFLNSPDSLKLGQDLKQDIKTLQNSSYFISDEASLNPSLKTVEEDLKLFRIAADLDLANASFDSNSQGKHVISKWKFPDGEISEIYQIESTLHLDTVITQRYLQNKAPTQQRIVNDFTFRTYFISTTTSPAKLYYLTEAKQGLLEYKINDRLVQIGYTQKDEGLNQALPLLKKEIRNLLSEVRSSKEVK